MTGFPTPTRFFKDFSGKKRGKSGPLKKGTPFGTENKRLKYVKMG